MVSNAAANVCVYLLLDTGFDLDHVNKVLPFEFPQQTAEQTIPG